MFDLKKYIDLWKRVLIRPDSVLKSEKGKAYPPEIAKNLILAGLISGIITGIAGALGIWIIPFVEFGLAIFITNIILITITNLFFYLILSAFLYVFAWLLGSKGNYTQQTYLISLFVAPLSIISTIMTIIFISSLTFVIVINLLILIYAIYLLTLALKYTHNFDIGRAILVWLLPIIIILLLVSTMVALSETILRQISAGLTV